MEQSQNTWIKLGVIGGLVIILATALLSLKWQHDVLVKQEMLNQSVTDMKQLGDGLVRSQSQYVSKDDLAAFTKALDLGKIQEDMKQMHADLRAAQVVTATTPGYTGTNLNSTTTIPHPTVSATNPTTVSGVSDPYDYWHNEQVLKLSEPTPSSTMPVGEVRFKAWQDKPWDVTLYPKTYKVTTVLGQDDGGKYYTYNKFSIETQGTEYPISINQAKVEEVKPEAKLRFSPRLYLGVGGGVALDTTGSQSPQGFLQPSLQISFLSYGQIITDPTWTFLGVGVGYEAPVNRGSLLISPVSYNIGHHLPLVNNVFLGPWIGIDTSKNITVSAGVQVGL